MMVPPLLRTLIGLYSLDMSWHTVGHPKTAVHTVWRLNPAAWRSYSTYITARLGPRSGRRIDLVKTVLLSPPGASGVPYLVR
jgi:hypothetical protein